MDGGLASDEDDDDIQSARSVYEDASNDNTTPAMTGSRFTRRKPVERYWIMHFSPVPFSLPLVM